MLAKVRAILLLLSGMSVNEKIWKNLKKKRVGTSDSALSRKTYERRLRRCQRHLQRLEAQERLKCQTNELIRRVRQLLDELSKLANSDIS